MSDYIETLRRILEDNLETVSKDLGISIHELLTVRKIIDRSPWRSEETRVLSTYSPEDAAIVLGWTTNDVYAARARLGITNTRNVKPWTDAEDEFLVNHVGTAKQAAKALGRTEAAVNQRRRHLNAL
jgi:hypothetical protein